MTRLPLGLAFTGVVAALVAAGLSSGPAEAAARQDWPAFALVTGLLLIGAVAAQDGVFSAAGHWLARFVASGRILLLATSGLVLVVTALLNLDTSVAFLTPVVAHTARQRGKESTALLAACLLLSNAGSLLLPGSNLTNLIVLGHLHLPGSRFVARMGFPWLVVGTVTAAVIAGFAWRELATPAELDRHEAPRRPRLGLGMAAIVAAAGSVVALKSPALPVLAIGAAVAAVDLARLRLRYRDVLEVVGVPVLVGLFGLAVAMGTLGRDWSDPARAMAHLDSWATAGVAAVAAAALNNLPAASLLAARTPPHPFSLLIGLNVGPNLLPSGSLAWMLWIQSARRAGVEPPVRATIRMGLLGVPLSVAAGVGTLLLIRLK